MKRILALMLALLMLSSSALAAGSFHAGVTFGTDENGNTTITVQDSEIFKTQTTKLTVACAYDEAYVVLGNQVVKSNLEDGFITFTVISGGTYTILEGKAPVQPEPDVPSTGSKPGQSIITVTKKNPFTDVAKGDWFYDAVTYVSEHGLMNGTGDGAFSPNATTTRGMIVTILTRMEGVDSAKGETWYEVGRQWAMRSGISDGTNMEGSITREQLAAMLYRYAKGKGYDVSAKASLKGFTDADQVSDWAQDAMQWAVAVGLMQGDNQRLTPATTATRAQVATMLMRFGEKFQ